MCTPHHYCPMCGEPMGTPSDSQYGAMTVNVSSDGLTSRDPVYGECDNKECEGYLYVYEFTQLVTLGTHKCANFAYDCGWYLRNVYGPRLA